MRVTHDLRTPLTAIRGHAAALSDGVVPQEDVLRSLAAIEGEATRLETLVADLLDLARLDAHRFTLDLARVEPSDVLDRAFDAMEAEATARGVSYERSIDPMPTVVTDESRVQQIVVNLLDNALRWTPAGGTVRLEGRSLPSGGFAAAVTDTGPGVPDRDRERIFDAFLSLETPDGQRGSGLGLAISRQLARALGGDVRVESREGAGSRFVLELPAKGARAGGGRPGRRSFDRSWPDNRPGLVVCLHDRPAPDGIPAPQVVVSALDRRAVRAMTSAAPSSRTGTRVGGCLLVLDCRSRREPRSAVTSRQRPRRREWDRRLEGHSMDILSPCDRVGAERYSRTIAEQPTPSCTCISQRPRTRSQPCTRRAGVREPRSRKRILTVLLEPTRTLPEEIGAIQWVPAQSRRPDSSAGGRARLGGEGRARRDAASGCGVHSELAARADR